MKLHRVGSSRKPYRIGPIKKTRIEYLVYPDSRNSPYHVRSSKYQAKKLAKFLGPEAEITKMVTEFRPDGCIWTKLTEV